jgi:hypothetical protein
MGTRSRGGLSAPGFGEGSGATNISRIFQPTYFTLTRTGAPPIDQEENHRRNEEGHTAIGNNAAGEGPRMSNATVKHPFEFQERQREQQRKDALINALEAFAPDDQQLAIDEALKHIATKRQRQEFKNRFDKLSTEEMGLALVSVRRRD